MAAIRTLMDVAFHLRHHIISGTLGFGTIQLDQFNDYLSPYAEVVVYAQQNTSALSEKVSAHNNDQPPIYPRQRSEPRARFSSPTLQDHKPTPPTSTMLPPVGGSLTKPHARNAPKRKRRGNNDPQESDEAGPPHLKGPGAARSSKKRRVSQLSVTKDDGESSRSQRTSSENPHSEGQAQHRRHESQPLTSSTEPLYTPGSDPELPWVMDTTKAKAAFLTKWRKRTKDHPTLQKLANNEALFHYDQEAIRQLEPFYELDQLMERACEFGSMKVRRQFAASVDDWIRRDDRAVPDYGQPPHLGNLDLAKREDYDRLWIAIQMNRHRRERRQMNKLLGRISLIREMREYAAIVERFGASDPELNELNYGDQVSKLFSTVVPASSNAVENQKAAEDLRQRFEKARPWLELLNHYGSEGIFALVPFDFAERMFRGDDRTDALLQALDLVKPELRHANVHLEVYENIIDSLYRGVKPSAEDMDTLEQLTKVNIVAARPPAPRQQARPPPPPLPAPHIQPSLAFTGGSWIVPSQPIIPSSSAPHEQAATWRPVTRRRRPEPSLPPPADPSPPENEYATQLKHMHEMGFDDDEKNLLALKRRKGDVHGAVGYLLENEI
ncbi:MAG: hypothetical protein Q9182_001899 [Xanthomendoza sp. 2 TL-2023]